MAANSRKVWQFSCVLLTALGLTMGGAHLLELPPRMQYDAQLYTAVTSTLFRYYAIVGAPIQLGALITSAVLCWLVRGRRSFGPTLAGAVCLAASLGLWAWLVQPVNSEWARVLSSDPATAPAVYLRLRDHWEYGHAAAFVAWLLGFIFLLGSLLADEPR